MLNRGATGLLKRCSSASNKSPERLPSPPRHYLISLVINSVGEDTVMNTELRNTMRDKAREVPLKGKSSGHNLEDPERMSSLGMTDSIHTNYTNTLSEGRSGNGEFHPSEVVYFSTEYSREDYT